MSTRARVPASIELIQRSIDTIEDRLDGELSLEALARDAVFEHRGGGRAWEYTLHYVFDTWRGDSGERLTDRPVFYRFDPATSPFSAEPELELWIALAD